MIKELRKRKTFLFLTITILILCAFCVVAFASADFSESKGKIDVYLIAGQSNAVGYGENLSLSDERFT